MARLEVQLVDESGRRIGFGDRWRTHRVTQGPDGPILGRKHVGITIACVDDSGGVLIAHRKHRVFDKVWTLSGDTHPYRYQGEPRVETLSHAARRCAMDDLGVEIAGWAKKLTFAYAARDPRDPRYCENELLHIMVAKYGGPLRVNPKNAYQARWVELSEILKDSESDLKKEPLDRKYAPWVHPLVALPRGKIKSAFRP